jgi:hypothetical protein
MEAFEHPPGVRFFVNARGAKSRFHLPPRSARVGLFHKPQWSSLHEISAFVRPLVLEGRSPSPGRIGAALRSLGFGLDAAGARGHPHLGRERFGLLEQPSELGV